MLKIEINVEYNEWKNSIPKFKENISQAIKKTFKNVLKTVNQKVSGKTSKINGAIRGDFYDVYQKDNYNRPIAGLKGISTRIQGQSKAIRSAEIKWICWDFDTLERLTPYFLSPGVSVAFCRTLVAVDRG